MNKFWLLCLCICSGIKTFSQDTTQKIVPNRINDPSQQKKPYLILISADGLRYDLVDKYHAEHLIKYREQGVAADHMQPSYPSLTFPNHYSLVTGLYPAHHGIVDNTFYDRKKKATYSLSNKTAVADGSWYGGTPLWVLAEKQHMLSASFYWVASESNIQGIRPTYYYAYSTAIPFEQRVQVVKNWLRLPAEIRPHFITFYFPDVDHEEHRHGVESKETVEAVHALDENMGRLVSAVDSLGLDVNFIFVSDHGMMDIDTLNTIPKPQALDTVAYRIPTSLPLLHLYARDSASVVPTYQALKKEAVDYDVYLPDEMPARWHYSKRDDYYDRIGDIVLVSHPPKVFNLKRIHVNPGEHGFDPAIPEMWATFYAWGPAFKQHKKIKGFENIHVYPLITHILQLKYTEKIDGRFKVLKPALK
jgi:predicted AlkP superfamily pyrophosphatase or phosphodiesterase